MLRVNCARSGSFRILPSYLSASGAYDTGTFKVNVDWNPPPPVDPTPFKILRAVGGTEPVCSITFEDYNTGYSGANSQVVTGLAGPDLTFDIVNSSYNYTIGPGPPDFGVQIRRICFPQIPGSNMLDTLVDVYVDVTSEKSAWVLIAPQDYPVTDTKYTAPYVDILSFQRLQEVGDFICEFRGEGSAVVGQYDLPITTIPLRGVFTILKNYSLSRPFLYLQVVKGPPTRVGPHDIIVRRGPFIRVIRA